VDDGVYAGLDLSSNPAAVVVAAGGSNTQVFTIGVLVGAVIQNGIVLNVTWTGTEAISARAINGDTPSDTILANIVQGADVTITSITFTNGTGTYVGGTSFTARVNFTNAGASGVANLDAVLTFGGYTFISQNNPGTLVIPAGGSSFQTFVLTLVAGAATQVPLIIGATWNGTDQVSGMVISGNQGANTLSVNIQSRANVAITGMALTPIAAPGPYVAGMTITLTVTFTNTGGTSATVDATIDDGVYTGLDLAANPAAVVVAAGGTNTQVFSVPILAGATAAAVTIAAMWTGTEAISARAINGGPNIVLVNIQLQAIVVLSVITAAGNVYSPSAVFNVFVTFTNTGGTQATVDAVLVFTYANGTVYTDLSQDNPAGVVVAAGATVNQTIQVTVAASPANGLVLISATWTGSEQYSARAINGVDLIPDTVTITREMLQIRSVSGANGRTGINTGAGVTPTVALGVSPLAINSVNLRFWRDGSTQLLDFTFVPLGASGNIAAGTIRQFTIWVTVPGTFTEYGVRFAVTANVTGTYIALPLSQDTAVIPFENYNDRDAIMVVNSFLAVAFNSANPGLTIDVSTGIDVAVFASYTITSTCWEPISINFINALFSNLAYVVGASLQVPANGAIVIPAGGSRVVSLNFTVDASAVTFTDTLLFSFDVVNNNASKGLSQASAAAQTFTLTSEIDVNSWTVSVLRANGTVVISPLAIGFYDTLRLNLNASAPNLGIRMTIVASDNGSISIIVFGNMTQTAPGIYNSSYSMQDMTRSNAMANQNRRLNISLEYQIGAIFYPLSAFGNVLYYIPAPLPFTSLSVTDASGTRPINVASTPITADIEATLVSLVRATFTNSLTSARTVSVLLASRAGAQYSDILYEINMQLVGGTWNCGLNSSTGGAGISGLWQAGLRPGTIYAYFNVTDTYGNSYDTNEVSLMATVVLRIVDTIAPVVNIGLVESLAGQTLVPDSAYELHVFVPVAKGGSYTRQVVMYLSSTQPTNNSLAAWKNTAGVTTLRFSLISSATGEWMAVLPPQAPSSQLYWAFYAQDYAGNDNAVGLATSTLKLVYAADPTAALEMPVGYALIGVMAFGLIFAISYRVQQGVQSVKKAKKVSAAVKKAAPGKTIGGTSSKSPVSKDIPTKACPICKAKIGADLDECPYCHKKF
jgi:hypothetical protein